MSKQNFKETAAEEEAVETLEAVAYQWVSPLDINYIELTKLLGDTSLEDYVGDKLPEDEVKRIKTDYELFLNTK